MHHLSGSQPRVSGFQVLHFRRSLKLLQLMADPGGLEFVSAAAAAWLARCPLFIRSQARSLVEILEIWPIFVGGKFINRVNSKGETRQARARRMDASN